MNEDGFTLIEMLIVLTITMFFVLLAVPFTQKTIKTVKERSFSELLESDVLFLQNTGRGGVGLHSLAFADDFYYLQRSAVIQKRRPYPENWTRFSSSHLISYTPDGRIRQPMTVSLRHENGSYNIIFGFGRGRYRIE